MQYTGSLEPGSTWTTVTNFVLEARPEAWIDASAAADETRYYRIPVWPPVTDQDADGVADLIENNAPYGGDGNFDGVARVVRG